MVVLFYVTNTIDITYIPLFLVLPLRVGIAYKSVHLPIRFKFNKFAPLVIHTKWNLGMLST